MWFYIFYVILRMKHICILKVHVKSRQIGALIDTGATCSFISSEMVFKLGCNVFLSNKFVTLKTALSKRKCQLKWVIIPIKIKNTVHKLKLCVVDNLYADIVIGRSHCEKLDIDIKFSTGEILIQGETVLNI